MNETTEKSGALENIRRRIHLVERLNVVRSAALPLAAAGAAAGLAVPVVFPIVAGTAAILVIAEEAFTRSQRRILDREIADYKARFQPSPSEVTALSTSANNATVAGSSS
jgi:hypothetical protein